MTRSCATGTAIATRNTSAVLNNPVLPPGGMPCPARLRRVSKVPGTRLEVTLRALVVTGSSFACLGTAHQLINQRVLRSPPTDPPQVSAAVSILVPARDEAHR